MRSEIDKQKTGIMEKMEKIKLGKVVGRRGFVLFWHSEFGCCFGRLTLKS